MFVCNSIHLMRVKPALSLYLYRCVKFLEDWCLKVVSNHIYITGLNPEFSFSLTSCHTMLKEPSLSNNLSMSGGRIVGCITFPRVLVLCEMQTALSKIWTWVAVSVSYALHHDPLNKYKEIAQIVSLWKCISKDRNLFSLIQLIFQDCLSVSFLWLLFYYYHGSQMILF